MNQAVIYVVGFLIEPPQHEPGRDLCGAWVSLQSLLNMNQAVIYVVGFLTEPPQHEPGRDLCGGFPYRATST